MADAITIRESPQKMAVRMSKQYGIDQKMAKQLIATSFELAEIFETVAGACGTQSAVKWVAGPVSANWKALEASGADPKGVIPLIQEFSDGKMTDTECGIQIKCLMTGEDAESVESSQTTRRTTRPPTRSSDR